MNETIYSCMRTLFTRFAALSIVAAFVFTPLAGNAQSRHTTSPDPKVKILPVEKIPLAAKINASEVKEDWSPVLKNTKKIHTPGVDQQKDHYLEMKRKANEARSQNAGQAPQKTSGTQTINPPEVGYNFFGNTFDGGIPNDNSLAVSKGGKVVSATNSRIHMYDETGGQALVATSLGAFVAGASGVGNGSKFDPKVTYDPDADRFIIVFLNGSSPNASRVIMCFSETNDPTGNWNIYGISGNPNSMGVWTDFPQIGISTDELFITGNLFTGSSSQGSVVWQVDLSDGYAGNALTIQTFTTQYFSLHPVEGGLTMYGPHFYLIRTSTTGPSSIVDVHRVSGTIANGGVIENPVALSSTNGASYVLAPDADQQGTNTPLSTNDCRVQSSYFENNRIQFALNSSFTNRPAIYYGTVEISPFDLNFSAHRGDFISDPDYELAFPAVSYSGNFGNNGNGSFIMSNYCAPDKYAGSCGIYLDEDGNLSPVKEVRVGGGAVGQGGSAWRWGDYADICERHNNPGEAWLAGGFARTNGVTATYIAQLFPPMATSSTSPEPVSTPEVSVVPNPVVNQVRFEFEVNDGGEYFVTVLDASGREIKQLVNHYLFPGEAALTFDAANLAEGAYFVRIVREGAEVMTKKFVVTH